MPVRQLDRWRRLALLVACSAGVVLPGAAMARPAAPDAAPALRVSRLQAEPQLQDARYLLRPRLAPVRSRRDATGTVVMSTALTPKGAATCEAGLIFRDGFEAS